jgi:peptide/nickel transport system permease protein
VAESEGAYRVIVRRVLRQPIGLAAVVYLALLVAAVAAAPLVAPLDAQEQDLHHVLATPSAAHVLGTDDLGRDVLSRLLYGGRVTLLGALQAVAVVAVVGVPIGLVAGFVGGRASEAIMRVADVLLAIPAIIMLLVVLALFGADQTAAMVAFGLLGAPALVRLVRGATLAIRREPYIAAARVMGLSTPQIIRRHVLPRVAGPVAVQLSLFAGAALITQSGLAFLGLTVQDPDPSWGGMIATASTVIDQQSWLLVPPGVILGVTVLALGLLGDAVRDALGGAAAPRRLRPTAVATAGDDAAVERTAAAPLLSVRALSVAFDAPVVERVSFDVQAGEIVGLVGESGCGKTVTGRAILGLVPRGGRVVGGSCRLDGIELTRLDAAAYAALRGAQVAMIWQEPVASLDPNFRVGAQLEEVVRRHHRVSRGAARSRAVELLERVRMPDPQLVAGRYPHELSGGMAQRVGIAAALAGEPRLLIADEPTTALDVTVQAEILDLLRTLRRDTGVAVLLITHDWGVVADLCDRAVVMYAGEVVECTDVASMFRKPLHPYTDGLMRSDPHGAEAGSRLVAIPGAVPAPGRRPAGCHFHPRCPLATDACAAAPVPLLEPAAGRLTRCIHHDRLAA